METISTQRLRATFGRVKLHRLVGHIIRHYSTNKADICRLALEGISFSTPVRVLDLGCGYGQFTAHLKGLLPAGSACLGIDQMESNRPAYLQAVEEAGLEGCFRCAPVERIADLAPRSFDLILASYSFYFFTPILPRIARILTTEGWFISITHSTRALRELITDMEVALGQGSPSGKRILPLQADFNAENGVRKLSPYFRQVERILYPNRLVFPFSELERCFYYLDFKGALLRDEDVEIETGFTERLHAVVRDKSRREGSYILTKDDAIFRCRGPKLRSGNR